MPTPELRFGMLRKSADVQLGPAIRISHHQLPVGITHSVGFCDNLIRSSLALAALAANTAAVASQIFGCDGALEFSPLHLSHNNRTSVSLPGNALA